MHNPAEKLIFVYNADSGLFNTATDIAHKILSPQTYSCDLCALTHGHFRIRKEWVAFLESLPLEQEFLHRDEYRARYGGTEPQPPAVLLDTGEGPELLLDRQAIAACRDLAALKQRIRAGLDAHQAATA
ncbi:MAG: hypothetical protein CMN57_07670 [Gammaproteobacteria bacterium]|nr:hypothetical protein [Gammaproteobacteria bacterium]